jgi:hypothetical protein
VKPKNVEEKFDSFAQTHARTHSHTHSHIHAHAPAHASFHFPSPNQIKSFSKNLSLMLCVFRTLTEKNFVMGPILKVRLSFHNTLISFMGNDIL